MSFFSEFLKTESPRKRNTRIFGILAAVFCLTGFLLTKSSGTEELPVAGKVSAETVFSTASKLSGTENSAGNGEIFFRKYDRNPAVLHVVNKAASDTFISLCDGLFGKSVLKFYLRAGEELTINTPVGYYEFQISTGAEWKNEDELFGSGTLYFTDGSEYGQELGRKKTCEFTIESGFANLIPKT